jgi:hypothetical protein
MGCERLLQHSDLVLLEGPHAELAIDYTAAGRSRLGDAPAIHAKEDAREYVRRDPNRTVGLIDKMELLEGPRTELAIDYTAAGRSRLGDTRAIHAKEDVGKLD